jgi:small GTP-binding protein
MQKNEGKKNVPKEKMLPSYDEIDFVLKVVVCGAESCGKTSLTRRFAESHFSIDEAPTLGVGLYIRVMPASGSGRIFKLQIWDTSGKPRFQAVSGGWFQDAIIYVFVYDTCSRNSFNQLDTWLTQAHWSTTTSTSKMVGILVGTKTDCITYREVDREQGEAFAAEHSLHFVETSALTGDQVASVFQRGVDVMDGVCRELTQQELLPLMPFEDNATVTLIESSSSTAVPHKRPGCCC